MTRPQLPPDYTQWGVWHPMWCKDAEDLASPCPQGHVDRDVTDRGMLFCRTCAKATKARYDRGRRR
jgi:hypothetical protein